MNERAESLGYGGEPCDAPSHLFQTANAEAGSDELRPDYARIVETLSPTNAKADYDELEANLEVGESRGDYGTLRVHLDKAESRARKAHRLYLGAKIELARWEADQNRVMSALRKTGRAALEERKAAGELKKAITNVDVDDWIAEYHHDEWRHQELTRAKLKALVEDMEHLAQVWKSKCSDLRTLLETLRK